MRYFSPWKGERIVEDFYLPRSIQKIAGQKKTRIGDALISTRDSCMGTETCEELFTPRAPGIGAGLDGCEIISNSSGSHHELRKLNTRIDLIREATLKAGGIYLYANEQGCSGDSTISIRESFRGSSKSCKTTSNKTCLVALKTRPDTPIPTGLK
jgi:NAD+ synthase (glutamine-hydrolysing)